MRFIPLLALIAAGCTDASTDPPLPTGTLAVVTTSGGFMAGGAVNTVRLSDKLVTPGLDTTIDQDNAVRVGNGKAYVLNRTPGSMFVYDLATWKSPVEIQTGDATQDHNMSNPQDLMPVPGTTKVYVSTLGFDGAHAVGVIDTAMPQKGVLRWVSIPNAAADTDGNPNASSLYFCQGRVFVLLQDLSSTTFAPTGAGRIATIDVTTDALLSVIQLQGQNPASIASISSDCNQVVVADSGPFGLAPDGTAGMERVNLAVGASIGMLFKDTDVMGRPATVSVRSSSLAFSAIFFDLESTSTGPRLQSSKVIAFNPTTGKVTNDAVTGAAAFIPFTAVGPDGSLFVGVDPYSGSMAGGKLAAGLYVGKADGTALPATPIDLGQNPYAIAFE